MLRKLPTAMSLALAAALAIAPTATAQDTVDGSFELTWNECFEAPSELVPDWIGTADIGGQVHDMVFFNVGDGRPPNHALGDPYGSFNEIWAIYDNLNIVYDEECAPQTFEGDLVLWGLDRGTSNGDLMEYQMVGSVEEAFGDYADLAGKGITMSGTFYPDENEVLHAPGIFTIG